MTAPSPADERFVRRTQLGPDEYRKNFRQIDTDIITAVTSPEADAVTPLMSKIYLRLTNAPEEIWERVGVLRFAGREKNREWVTAWEQLVNLTGVASATARKALQWMHGQGIIGYFAAKNGVGIRIFLNRAASSIGRRHAPGQKNLRLVRASSEGVRASAGDTPFRDSFADLEVLETDLNPRAPKNGAGSTGTNKTYHQKQKAISPRLDQSEKHEALGICYPAASLELNESVMDRLESVLRTAATQAAAREHERIREWLESRGLPKAARVAQREAFNLLRQHGLVGPVAGLRNGLGVGRSESVGEAPRQLSAEEIRELAETCIAMLEVHGQAIDVTLSALSEEVGGMLLSHDAQKVRELVKSMAEPENTKQRRER